MVNNNNNNNNNNHKNAYQKRQAAIVSNEKSHDIHQQPANQTATAEHTIFGIDHHHHHHHHHQQQQQPQQYRWTNLNNNNFVTSPPSAIPFAPPPPSTSSSLFSTNVPSPSSLLFEMAAEHPNHHGPHHHQHHPSSSLRTANSNHSTNKNHHHHHHRSMIYVYELPYNIRKSICDLLDADNSWRELGGRYMGFNDTQLTLISHALYRSASPTNELLTKWESSNAKISHLFMYLAQLKHHRAMYYLLPFVNQKLRLVYEKAAGNPSMMAADHDHDNPDNYQTFSPNSPMQPGLSLLSMNQEAGKIMAGNRSGLILKQSIHNNDFKDEHLRKSNEEKTLIDIKHHNQNNNNDKDEQAKQSNRVNDGNDGNLNEINDKRNKLIQNCPEYLLKIDDFKISYKELMIATDDFAKDNILGSGGFGTVFIGDWKGTKVAVKKLKGLDNLTQALTELRILNCCRIDNILPLYAVSLDGPEPCLVYQYMPNGSLEDRLLCKNNTPPLTWHQRAKIGEGVARALNFLHTLKGNPFVHGDVKSANILLDPMFEPRLGDFGLARQVVKNSRNENSIYTHCTVTSVNGTSVYLPAEYLRQKILSPAVDVYSYGIVILEMATGRRAYNGKKLLINSVEDEYIKAAQQASINFNQPNSIKASNHDHHGAQNSSATQEKSLELLMDKRIANQTEGRHLFNYLLELGRRCAHKTKSKRPIMVQILEYFNQCKSTERIHRLCDKVIQNKLSKMSISKASIKNPMELQLWYDFVRKSCGTLSEVVFENFDAQVTKIIEDLASRTDSIGDESTYCLDLLLKTKNRNTQSKGLQESLVTTNNNNQNDDGSHPTQNSIDQSSMISIASSTSSMLNATCRSFNNNNGVTERLQDSETKGANSKRISQLLRMIHSNNNNNTDTIDPSPGTSHEAMRVSMDGEVEDVDHNDEMCRDVNHENDDHDHDDDHSDPAQDEDGQSGPLIPLLTALGFDRSKFDELIGQ